MYPKICKICGKNEKSIKFTGRFCIDCFNKKRRESSRIGPYQVICFVCGENFISRIKTGKFCSKKCKTNYNNDRLSEYKKTERGSESRKRTVDKFNRSEKRREYSKKWARERRSNDISFKLNENIRGAIYKQLKRTKTEKNRRHWETIIGGDLNSILKHIENQFDNTMCFDNYGKVWNIDHIIPVASYNLEDPDELKKCWNERNLRPLLKEENLLKRAYFDNELIDKYNINDLRPKGKEKCIQYKKL